MPMSRFADGKTKKLMFTTRRQFLEFSTSGLVLAALSGRVHAATPRGQISLGMSLYGMKTLSLPEAFAQCARIGYRNVELCLDAGFPAEPAKLDAAARKQVRADLARHGLQISALMLNLNLATPEIHATNLAAIKAAGAFAHDLAPDRPPPIETVSRGKPLE